MEIFLNDSLQVYSASFLVERLGVLSAYYHVWTVRPLYIQINPVYPVSSIIVLLSLETLAFLRMDNYALFWA